MTVRFAILRRPERPLRSGPRGRGERRRAAAGLALLLVVGAACAHAPPPVLPPWPEAAGGEVSFREQVLPVLEHRCVVCHGCYDAPCQLLLSSEQGIARGATKSVVYDGGRHTDPVSFVRRHRRAASDDPSPQPRAHRRRRGRGRGLRARPRGAVHDAPGFEQVAARWGVRRTSPHLWETVDWMHEDFRRRQPTELGLFDLDRFDNL